MKIIPHWKKTDASAFVIFLLLIISSIVLLALLAHRKSARGHRSSETELTPPETLSLEITEDIVGDEEFVLLVESALNNKRWGGLRSLHTATLNVNRMYNNTDVIRESFHAKRHPVKVVPNIVHYIWFGNERQFEFLYYLSVMSAWKIQQPDVIMFHHDVTPSGPWWEELVKRVPLKMMFRVPPPDVYEQKLGKVFHQGDVTKLEVLIEYGGIYVDLDVLILRSMDPLRHYDLSVGKEIPPKFIAGAIVAKKNARFLLLWYESYKDNYIPEYWDYNCAKVPYFIHLFHPTLVHVEPYRLTTPDWLERHLLTDATIDWGGRHLYILHAMSHLSDVEITPDCIKLKNTTITEAANFIYGLDKR